jgi:polyisoprenoid-binding protein YceI
MRLLAIALVGAALVTTSLTGCKSELDNKPTAKVEPASTATPAEEAKPATPAEEAKPAEAAAPVEEAKPVEAAPEEAAKPVEGARFDLDPAKSALGFVGAKITGDHTCKFNTISGSAVIAGDAVASLEVVADMASVETDSEKLTGHLKSADFFDVEKFPTSTFKATTFAPSTEAGATHTITGDLTLHGVTKQLTFPATVTVSATGATGKSEFKINRKDFGIVYPGKPDDLIRDEVLLKLDLAFTPAPTGE